MASCINKKKKAKAKAKINKREINLTPEILEGLAIAGILVVGAISPLALGAFSAAFVIDRKYRKNDIPNRFYYLKNKGYIKYRNNKDKINISLTRKGVTRLKYYKLRNLKITKPKKWDGKWRIVFFDIPAYRHSVRDALRKSLKRLNFHQFQKSVWIYPFPCDTEINFVRNYFSIKDRELRYIISQDIGDDLLFIKKFALHKKI